MELVEDFRVRIIINLYIFDDPGKTISTLIKENKLGITWNIPIIFPSKYQKCQ